MDILPLTGVQRLNLILVINSNSDHFATESLLMRLNVGWNQSN